VKLVEQVPEGRQIIQRYGNGGFHVSGRQHMGAILVLADHTVAIEASSPDALDAAALADALAPGMAVELLLVGSGPAIRHVSPAAREALQAAHIGFDVMNTGAACRTYNLLLSEGRHVAALLFPVD